MCVRVCVTAGQSHGATPQRPVGNHHNSAVRGRAHGPTCRSHCLRSCMNDRRLPITLQENHMSWTAPGAPHTPHRNTRHFTANASNIASPTSTSLHSEIPIPILNDADLCVLGIDTFQHLYCDVQPDVVHDVISNRQFFFGS